VNTCVIVGAGDLLPEDLPEKKAGDFWIAADGGMKALAERGIAPDLFLGDLDSLEKAPEAVPARVLPVKKDDTDSAAAVKAGLKRGFREFLLLGSLGGKRLSHTVANFQLLLFLKENGANGTLRRGGTEVFCLRAGEKKRLENKTGFFSLFAAGENAAVTIRGAKFSGEKITLTPSFPLGVSNEPEGESEIEVLKGGVYLVID